MALLVNYAALALWQDSAVIPSTDMHLLTYSVVVLAAISLIQFLALVIGSLVIYGKVKGLSAKLERMAQPAIAKTQELVAELTPKVRTLAENVQQISYTVRAKVDEVGQTVSKINETVEDTNVKTRAQVSRVDGMVSDALATAHEVSRTLQDGIKYPIRQAAGVIAAVKTGLETLAERSSLLHPTSEGRPTTVQKPSSGSDLSDLSNLS